MHLRFVRIFTAVKSMLLVLCLPAIIWNVPLSANNLPTNTGYSEGDYTNFSPWDLLNYETLSYQHIIDFLYEVAYGNTLEKHLTEAQTSQVMEFVIFLARNGIRDDDLEAKAQLEEDIKWLRGEPNNSELAFDDECECNEGNGGWWWSSLKGYEDYGVKAVPAVLNGSQSPIIKNCGWISNTWKSTKKFVKRNKKVVIISAVVVVAATVVIIATSGAATPVIAAGAAAVDYDGNGETKPKNNPKPRTPVNKAGEVNVPYDAYDYDTSLNNSAYLSHCDYDRPKEIEALIPKITPQLEPIPERNALLKETIERQNTTLKEELSQEPVLAANNLNIPKKDEASFWSQAAEKARKVGSYVVHNFVDGTANFVESLGKMSSFLYDDYPPKREPFDEFFSNDVVPFSDRLHDKIDQSFNTDYAGQYGSFKSSSTPETMGELLKELGKDVVFCFVPVPGSQLSKPAKIAKSAKAIAKVAKASGVVKGMAITGALITTTTTNPPIPRANTLQVEVQTPVVREQGNISVYRSIDKATDEVQYVGITNNLSRRQLEHWKSKGIKVDEMEGISNLTRSDARAVEQTLIEMHKLEKNGGTC